MGVCLTPGTITSADSIVLYFLPSRPMNKGIIHCEIEALRLNLKQPLYWKDKLPFETFILFNLFFCLVVDTYVGFIIDIDYSD